MALEQNISFIRNDIKTNNSIGSLLDVTTSTKNNEEYKSIQNNAIASGNLVYVELNKKLTGLITDVGMVRIAQVELSKKLTGLIIDVGMVRIAIDTFSTKVNSIKEDFNVFKDSLIKPTNEDKPTEPAPIPGKNNNDVGIDWFSGLPLAGLLTAIAAMMNSEFVTSQIPALLNLGKWLLPTITTKFDDFFVMLSNKFGSFSKYLGGVYDDFVSKILAPIGRLGKKLGTSMLEFITPYFKQFTNFIGEGIEWISKLNPFKNIGDFIEDKAGGAVKTLKNVGGKLFDFGSSLAENVKAGSSKAMDVANMGKDAILKHFDTIINKNIIGKALKMAGGGLVRMLKASPLGTLINSATAVGIAGTSEGKNTREQLIDAIPQFGGLIGGGLAGVLGSLLGPAGGFFASVAGGIGGEWLADKYKTEIADFLISNVGEDSIGGGFKAAGSLVSGAKSMLGFDSKTETKKTTTPKPNYSNTVNSTKDTVDKGKDQSDSSIASYLKGQSNIIINNNYTEVKQRGSESSSRDSIVNQPDVIVPTSSKNTAAQRRLIIEGV